MSCGVLGWLSWVSVRLLVSAQIMILRFPELEPCVGLCSGSLAPAWDPLSLSLSLYPSPTRTGSLSLSLSK